MTAAVAPLTITEPGVYSLAFADYLADPVPGGSLSTSGAKTLLNDCPARFAYEREHGRPDKRTFDIGQAAHRLVLGDGPDVEVIPGEWRTKAAKDAVAEARARGAVPLHTEDWDAIQGMAAALLDHPIASKVLAPDRGTPEQSLFWIDPDTGVWRRARLDQMPHPTIGRMVLADYKTCESAKPSACQRAIANYSYHMQGAAYMDAVTALELAEHAAFLLIFQEKTPPYLITPVEMSANALRIGRERNQRALEIFRTCTETNTWPAYTQGIELLDLPVGAERAHEMEMT